jgi:glycosyltransferase involved in cell wall biosynthesis
MLSAIADDAEVRWIGGGDDGSGLRAMREAGVHVTGWLPRAATLRSLSESTLYLHWTAWDGLPLSILEAMANDVVVVASDIGPNREVLGPDQVCRSEDDAVRLMRAILGDGGLRERLLAEQRQRRKWYGADRMASRWLELYTTLSSSAYATA